MLNLASSTTKIQLVTSAVGQIATDWSGVKATTAPAYTPVGGTNADITTATTTDIVAAPSGTDVINIKGLIVANESTTVTNSVTVVKTDGTNTVPLWAATLLPGERLAYDDGQWNYYAADGTLKTATVVATENFSTSNQTGFATDTTLAGSQINMPASFPQVGSRYHCKFDMTKTAAGTATFIVNVRYGTAGSTADAAIATFTFTAQTAAIDDGIFEIDLHFRTVGTGTSAVVVAVCELRHSLAATGLTTAGTGGSKRLLATSSGFASAVAGSILSVSVNGGTSFAGTNTLVEAQFKA